MADGATKRSEHLVEENTTMQQGLKAELEVTKAALSTERACASTLVAQFRALERENRISMVLGPQLLCLEMI